MKPGSDDGAAILLIAAVAGVVGIAVGIPFGIANFKMIPISLLPLGREIVPTDQPFATR